MKDIVKPAVILFIITAIAGALLGTVQAVTAPAIEEQIIKTENLAMQEVLSDADSFEILKDAKYEGTVSKVNKGLAGGEEVGYVISVAPSGFSGAIGLMVGISTDGTLQGIKVLTHAETPGLGALATEPSFNEKFAGKTEFPLAVIKNGEPKENEVVAITSATITTKAITDGVNEAYDWFESNGGAK